MAGGGAVPRTSRILKPPHNDKLPKLPSQEPASAKTLTLLPFFVVYVKLPFVYANKYLTGSQVMPTSIGSSVLLREALRRQSMST